ncbi:MAG: TRAP transporter small permease [Desulfatiglandales bacterium]
MLKISDRLNRLCEIALIVILGAMAIVVFLQVLFRYVLHLPLFWTEEFARYCLVWASLLGASVALKRQEHIAVTFFLERLPQRIARIVTIVGRISVGLILAVMTWGGAMLVMVTSFQISPALRIPMAIPYLALPIGSAVMLFHMITIIFSQRPEGSEKDLCRL